MLYFEFSSSSIMCGCRINIQATTKTSTTVQFKKQSTNIWSAPWYKRDILQGFWYELNAIMIKKFNLSKNILIEIVHDLDFFLFFLFTPTTTHNVVNKSNFDHTSQ